MYMALDNDWFDGYFEGVWQVETALFTPAKADRCRLIRMRRLPAPRRARDLLCLVTFSKERTSDFEK